MISINVIHESRLGKQITQTKSMDVSIYTHHI